MFFLALQFINRFLQKNAVFVDVTGNQSADGGGEMAARRPRV